MSSANSNAQTDSFAQLVLDAIDATSLSELARRWCVAEETIRNWRDDSLGGPRWRLLLRINFNDDERIRLCRLVSRGRLMIEPAPPAETFGGASPPRERDVYGATGELERTANNVQQTWHEALGDGVIDASERARIDAANDQVIHATRRTRPGFFSRLRGLIGGATTGA